VWEVWTTRAGTLLIAGCGAGFLPLLLGLWRRRMATIVVTCLLGTLVACAGGLGVSLVARPELWPSLVAQWYIAPAIAVLLFAAGVAVQSLGARKGRGDGGKGAKKDETPSDD
jgi:hypothetical protein